MKINELGEFGLIAGIASRFKDLTPAGCIGIGDDCSVIPISETRSMIITSDMLVEDIHFLRSEISAYELGYKSLSVNLSDVAAMGGTPHSSFLSIALPSSVTTEWCNDFFDGYKAHNVALLGGDTTKSTDRIVISVTAIGTVDSDKIKYRSGAKVGDRIYVSSTLGDSAGGLKAIMSGVASAHPQLVAAHNMPRPHLAEGSLLGANVDVHAMMDVSDGIASDLRHILKASGVGAEIDIDRIPISEALRASPWSATELALSGGEDYCLLFTAAPSTVLPFYEIGRITGNNIGEISWLEDSKVRELDVNGFTHF